MCTTVKKAIVKSVLKVEKRSTWTPNQRSPPCRIQTPQLGQLGATLSSLHSPSIPFLSTLPSLPFPSPFSSLPLEVGPLSTARGSGMRCKHPQRKSNSVHFSLKIWHLVAPILLIFLGVGPRSDWTASSLENKCLDAVHDRPPTL